MCARRSPGIQAIVSPHTSSGQRSRARRGSFRLMKKSDNFKECPSNPSGWKRSPGWRVRELQGCSDGEQDVSIQVGLVGILVGEGCRRASRESLRPVRRSAASLHPGRWLPAAAGRSRSEMAAAARAGHPAQARVFLPPRWLSRSGCSSRHRRKPPTRSQAPLVLMAAIALPTAA